MFHRLARFALPALLGVGFLATTTTMTHAALSPADQSAIVAAHNAVRRRVSAAETQRLGQTVTIPDLTWNAAAASVAQGWADHELATHTFAHNPSNGGYGENIYMDTGYGPVDNGNRPVTDWASEQSAYNWDANSCSAECGHYTQIVWAGTTSVGCGVATNGTDTYWVCDYAPPGNVTGQRPYEPAGGAAPTQPATPPGGAAPGTPPPPTTAGASSLTGFWSVDDFGSGAGGTLSLVQVGSQVGGTYSYDDPSGCGTQTGTFVGSTDGVSLTFSTAEAGCAGSGSGSGTLIIAPDGNSFTGGDTWNGTRTG